MKTPHQIHFRCAQRIDLPTLGEVKLKGKIMASTGRDMQLTRQIGEHLVAAELGRLGYVATPFSGNIPMFDILAADQDGRAVPIQVKAIRGASWQFNARKFLEIDIENDIQIVRGETKAPYPDLLCIFVLLESFGKDTFYIFQWRDLQMLIAQNYKGGRRPKNPESMHCAVWPKDLEKFKDNWILVQTVLGRIVP